MRTFSFKQYLRKEYPVIFCCIALGVFPFTRAACAAQDSSGDFKTLLVQETGGLERTAELVVVDSSILPVPAGVQSVTITDADNRPVPAQIEDLTCLGFGRRLVFLLPSLSANSQQTYRVVFSNAPVSLPSPISIGQDKDVDGDGQSDLVINNLAGQFRQLSTQGGVLCYLAPKDATFSFIQAFNRPSVSFWLTPSAPTEVLMTAPRTVNIGSLTGSLQASKSKVVSAGPCTVITETIDTLDSESGQFQFTNVYLYRTDRLEVEAWGIFRCNKSFSSETAAMVAVNDRLRREGTFFSSTPSSDGIVIQTLKQYLAAFLPGYFGFTDPALEWSVSILIPESGQADPGWYKKNRTNGQAVNYFAWGDYPFSRDFTANLAGEEHFGPDHRPFFAAARAGFTWSFHAWLVALEGKPPQVQSIYQRLLTPVKVSLQP